MAWPVAWMLATWVAEIVEAEVDAARERVQVKRVVCAQDMGLVVNPEGAKIQVEGCITMGLGYALTEEVHFKGGKVLDTQLLIGVSPPPAEGMSVLLSRCTSILGTSSESRHLVCGEARIEDLAVLEVRSPRTAHRPAP